jgi:tetratricopeptide (TPR) repeat protein
VHAANTETVNYLSARSDVMSTLGLLAGFLVYARAPRARRLQLHVVPMLLGALAKTPAVVLGPHLLAYALLIEERLSCADVVRLRPRDRVRAALLRVAPTLVAGVLVFLFVEGMNPEAQTYGGPARSAYLRTQLWVWLRYLRLFVLPVGLTADADLAPIADVLDLRVLAGALAGLAVLAVAWVSSRTARGRVIALGIAWFLLGLAPSSSVFPLAEMMNEHRLYLPYVGLVLVAAVLLAGALERADRAAAPRRAHVLAAATIVLLGAHAIGTFQRNRVWRSEETLWADVVAKSPGNGRAWMNYGLTQMSQGRLEQALALFQRAEQLTPAYPYVHTNLGIVLDALGRPAEAEPELRRALELAPNFVEGHYFFARWLGKQGRGAEAFDHARRASELSPGYGPARALVLDLLYATGRADELQEAVAATLAVLPTHAEAVAYASGAPPPAATDARALGELAAQRAGAGDPVGAAVANRRAAELTPTADALTDLGRALALLGFQDEARAAYADALRVEPTHERARSALDSMDANPEA